MAPSSVEASNLHLNSSSTDFIPNLTPTINMTCAVDIAIDVIWTTVGTGSAVIGRRRAPKSLDQDANRLAPSSPDEDDIKFLSSLVIMRNGKDHVASITEHTPASATMDLDNLKVEGQITGSSGFLHLSWTYPSDAQAAQYTCESNGLNALGHYVSMTKTLEVGVGEPTLSDLVKYVGNQQKMVVGLQNTVKNLQQSNKDQEQKISTQEQVIASLNATVGDQNKEIANLRNVQTGIIDCGNRHGYSGSLPNYHSHQHDQYKTKTVSFNQTYIRAPEVHLSFSFVDDFAAQAYFRADLLSVSTTGFTMRCRGNSLALPDYMMVSWVSIPQ